MHRHLVTTEALLADTCVLGKEEARHLQTVLRVRPEDVVELFDGQGHTRRSVVVIPSHFMKCEGMDAESKISKNSLCLTATEPALYHPKPTCALTLFVCISKGKHMDWTLEKAVELGVTRIVPVISDRTIVRIDADDRDSKADRWRRIAEEAARQSGRAWLPEILPPCSFKESLELVRQTTPTFVAALTPDAKPLRVLLLPITSGSGVQGSDVGVQEAGRATVFDRAVMECPSHVPSEWASPACSESPALPASHAPSERGRATVSDRAAAAALHPPKQAGWFVGPEGDFTPDELQRLLDAGTVPVSLGPLVLRAETACLYGLCALNCAWM